MIYKIDRNVERNSFEVRVENGEKKNNSYLSVFDDDISSYIIGKSIVDRTISIDYHYNGELLVINKIYNNEKFPYADQYIISKDAYESFAFQKNVMKTIDDIRIKTNSDLVIDAYLSHDLESLRDKDIKLSSGELKDYVFMNSAFIRKYLNDASVNRACIKMLDAEIMCLTAATAVYGLSALINNDAFLRNVAILSLVFLNVGYHTRKKSIEEYTKNEFDKLYNDDADFKSFTRKRNK